MDGVNYSSTKVRIPRFIFSWAGKLLVLLVLLGISFGLGILQGRNLQKKSLDNFLTNKESQISVPINPASTALDSAIVLYSLQARISTLKKPTTTNKTQLYEITIEPTKGGEKINGSFLIPPGTEVNKQEADGKKSAYPIDQLKMGDIVFLNYMKDLKLGNKGQITQVTIQNAQ